MTHGKGKLYLGSKILIIAIVVFAIFNLICVEIIPAHYSSHGLKHDINHDNPLENLDSSKLSKTYDIKHKEFEITIEYTIQDIFRADTRLSRLLITNGGIECGLQGEERPFFKYLLETLGEIDSISVSFNDPIDVFAQPTPYLVPPSLGSNQEILVDTWEGAIEDDISASWLLNHLSEATVDNNHGELYSLKLYPVEFFSDGTAKIFRNVKVSYSVPQKYTYWPMSTLDSGHKPTGTVKYLIITHPDLTTAVEPFAKWKSQKGLFTQVITTEELDKMYSEGDLQFKMRKYVQYMESQYDLDYLFIIGDWDIVPTRNTKNSYAQPMMGESDTFASDLYFACVNPGTTWNKDGDSEYAEESELDDSIPDMANGRLAINSPSALSSILFDLVDREKNPTWNPNNERAVYMCGDPGYMPGNSTEVMDYFWTEYGDDVFSGRETIYYDNSGTLTYTSNSFKTVMNDQNQAMSYFGHGVPTGYPELFSNSEVPQLSNGTDGSIFAMACLTGWFDDPNQGTNMGAVENCFAEMLTETSDKGVVGYIGSSRIAVGYIDTVYSDDAPGLEEDYWRAIREAARGNITPTIGSVWRKTITNFASSFYPFRAQGFDNPGLRTFLEYNLLGEPEAPLIFRQPEVLQLEYELSSDKTSITAKVTNLTGEPVTNAAVTVYRYDELGRTSTTNSKGEVTINIPPNNGGMINITASRPGDIPVYYTFSLPDTLAPQPEYELTPKDPDGNLNYYISSPVLKLFGDEPVDVQYRLDEGSVVYSESSATIVVPDGNHTIHFRVVDEVGQWSSWFSVDVSVDLSPPELFLTTVPAAPDGNAGWFITKPTIILNSNEPLNNSLYTMDNGEETEYNTPILVPEGISDYSFIAYDLAGNLNKNYLTIKVDLSSPVSVAEVSHTPDGENGYYLTPPTIVLKSPEEPDASLEYRWDSVPWIKYTDTLTPVAGKHTLYYRSADLAGNFEIEHNMTFYLDWDAPCLNISVFPSEPDGENRYYCTNPVIDIASDSGEIYYSLVTATEKSSWKPLDGSLIIPDGTWVLDIKAVDLAGNVGYLDSIMFKVDTLPPALSWQITPAEVDGNSGWYTSSPVIKLTTNSEDTKLYWTHYDSESWNEFDFDITLTSGVHKLRFKAIDPAGNVLYNETDWLNVDLSPPELTIDQPEENAKVGTTVLVTWHGDDALSGIYEYKIRLDSKSWIAVGEETMFEFDDLKSGEHTIYVNAWDAAGNTKKAQTSLSVDGVSPVIISRLPRGDDVPVDAEIVIEFSEPMYCESVKIDVSGIFGTINWDGNTAIFVPEQKMEYSTKYNIEVTGVDKYNNSLRSKSWYFITESAPEHSEDSPMMIYVAMVIGIIITIIIVVCIVFALYRKKKKNI